MSRMDWVPVYRWGVRIPVPPNSQLDNPLMDPTIVGPDEVMGRFEESAGRYFVHRIVGLITADWQATPTDGFFTETIWPGLIDEPVTGTVVSPGFNTTAAGVNSRLWFIRHRSISSGSSIYQDIQPGANKWHAHVDITPRQVIDDGQCPIYSVANDDATETLDIRMYLRLLLTPLN